MLIAEYNLGVHMKKWMVIIGLAQLISSFVHAQDGLPILHSKDNAVFIQDEKGGHFNPWNFNPRLNLIVYQTTVRQGDTKSITVKTESGSLLFEV